MMLNLNVNMIPFLSNFKNKRGRKKFIALINFNYENLLILYADNENSKTKKTHTCWYSGTCSQSPTLVKSCLTTLASSSLEPVDIFHIIRNT